MQSLGKLVVVTGASKGIGSHIATSFASHGYSVAAISRTKEIQHLAQNLPVQNQQKHLGIACDVSNSSEITEAIKHIESSIGPIDVLVNAAGSIISIGSVIGLQGNVGQTVYSASKAGLVGFTKSLAKELGPRNVTANVIAPGFIDVGMTSRLSTETKSLIISQIPLSRFGKPEDVSATALFLATAHYITGQVIVVDGGLKL